MQRKLLSRWLVTNPSAFTGKYKGLALSIAVMQGFFLKMRVAAYNFGLLKLLER